MIWDASVLTTLCGPSCQGIRVAVPMQATMSPLSIGTPQPIRPGLLDSKRSRIYVGSIAFELTAEHLRSVFEAFGKVRSCELLPVQQ